MDNLGKFCCPYPNTLVSGSPIIQNGKLVGAVTHVLINDPTTGYGIFIEIVTLKMLCDGFGISLIDFFNTKDFAELEQEIL